MVIGSLHNHTAKFTSRRVLYGLSKVLPTDLVIKQAAAGIGGFLKLPDSCTDDLEMRCRATGNARVCAHTEAPRHPWCTPRCRQTARYTPQLRWALATCGQSTASHGCACAWYPMNVAVATTVSVRWAPRRYTNGTTVCPTEHMIDIDRRHACTHVQLNSILCLFYVKSQAVSHWPSICMDL